VGIFTRFFDPSSYLLLLRIDKIIVPHNPKRQKLRKNRKIGVRQPFSRPDGCVLYYWNYADGLEAARLETWLSDRMLKMRCPLREKLVLFWRGHFASGNEKVHDYRKMMGQFAMLRQNQRESAEPAGGHRKRSGYADLSR
jgi:hypothetical protein